MKMEKEFSRSLRKEVKLTGELKTVKQQNTMVSVLTKEKPDVITKGAATSVPTFK